MESMIDRRRFVQTTGLALASAAFSSPAIAAPAGNPADRIKKALGWDMIQEDLPIEDKFRLVKDLGFDGVEVNSQLVKKTTDPKTMAKASEKTGVPIHGISNASHPDLKAAVEEAVIYGATTVLHVARSDASASYLETYRRALQLVREAAPLAEQKKIYILVENVWATFLIEPMGMARFIDEIGSPYVKSYFDVGNVMRWGYPQQWIEVLGKRIGKIHIKEYSLKTAMKEGMMKAFDFPIGQGDIDWKRVREELAKIQFKTWATAEVRGGKRDKLAEISAQMDKVLFS